MSNRRFATALATALADLGLEHACLSPGSRNTPLLAAFANEARIRAWPVIDERSAGFFGLGLARATGNPVLLACTSGTAAAEYLPAVVEASQSDIPLLVLTADRPPELRGIGAPQTIDQVSLYGTAVRMFADALPPDEVEGAQVAAEVAIDIWAHATAAPPGPVHLNLPFREPLLEPEQPVQPGSRTTLPGTDELLSPDLGPIAARLDGRRGLIVAGRETDPAFPAACASLAAATGFPIIADPLSGLRFGPHDQNSVLRHGDQLAAAGMLDKLIPEVVVRFGPVPTSKPVWSWLEQNPQVDQVLIDIQSRDAARSARSTLELAPTIAAGAIARSIATPAPDEWLDSWHRLDAIVAGVVAEQLDSAAFPNEPALARILGESTPPGVALTVGSSMPIRDFDSFSGSRATSMRVFGNRGANGIDGVVSAAIGAAASGATSVALVGDVAMFHDLNSLGTAVQLALPVTIIVINNNGGGIFHFLPQHDPAILDPAVFGNYLATPHGTDFVAVARSLGLAAREVRDAAELRDHLTNLPSHPSLIQLTTDRRSNHELHRRIGEAVNQALRSRQAG